MTREEQETDRALQQAEHDWLRARGWVMVTGVGASLAYRLERRFAHPRAPTARESYTRRDALAMTRAEPLRYTKLEARA